MSDPSTVKRKLVPPTSCGVSAVGLRVTTLILGCSAYSCGFGVCCISLRASETFPRIVVMRFIFFPACDISVLAEGSMAAKNYTKNKACIHFKTYVSFTFSTYSLFQSLLQQWGKHENLFLLKFLFCTQTYLHLEPAYMSKYTIIQNEFIELYFKYGKKGFALTTQDSMWNKKCFLLVSSHILNIVHQIYKLLNHY